MSEKTYNKIEKAGLWLLALGITGLLGWNTTMQLEGRDNYKFIQPQIDKEQNVAINNLYHKFDQSDSIQCAKNKDVHRRIDLTNDVVMPINLKVDILLDLNKKAIERYNELAKYYKLQATE